MLRKVAMAGAIGALCVAGTGCVVHGQARTRAYVETPSLAVVAPGVYVVADYDRPIFYTDGYYWLHRDGIWLRSYDYTGGWVRASRVPWGVRRIHRPHAYVHYRPHARARVYRAPVRRGERPRPVHVDRRSRHVERRHR